MATATLVSQPAGDAQPKTSRLAQRTPQRPPTDDEILGIVAESAMPPLENQLEFNWNEDARDGDAQKNNAAKTDEKVEQNLQAALESNPELKGAWEDSAAYRRTFATPEEARAASTRLADLDRLDALFFSKRPEDHAELARTVASLDPASFNSLAAAMAQVASAARANRSGEQPAKIVEQPRAPGQSTVRTDAQATSVENPAAVSQGRGITQAQTDFLHSANAAAVEEVLHSIETQVDKLLPEEISKSARNRVVGEIYRELDSTLRSNRQLAQQMRDAFRSGALDADHQRAIVSLVAGRARQALPAVAKRVLNEWTSTIVAANQDRRARQRTAERRIDIAGSGRTGNDGHRPTSPRDIDYARMSDADILNL